MSTYLTAIVAGPYTYIESNKINLPPMKVYLRKSVLPSIKKEILNEMLSTA